jgi:hypothetical protein
MKTYALQQGHPDSVFDWNAFLALKAPTRTQCEVAVRKAHSWVTCACGNQCASIPRKGTGEPVDTLLNQHGLRFATQIENIKEAVYHLSFLEGKPIAGTARLNTTQIAARATLKQIEERAAELIFQQHAPES